MDTAFYLSRAHPNQNYNARGRLRALEEEVARLKLRLAEEIMENSALRDIERAGGSRAGIRRAENLPLP